MTHNELVKGYHAFDALAATPAGGSQAGTLLALSKQFRALQAEYIFVYDIGKVSIDCVRYDPEDEDGYFWIGPACIDASSFEVREVKPDIWWMIDRWADYICFSSDPDAPLQNVIDDGWSEI